ncbi:MAG: TPM domain-containing protein [Winogradskyella sp.]|uniref:TPM domain-containing protein n=1 Tax=Winogradskyella sp. TaxID=1883156 RepID=UPI0025DD3C93|nr:TPM domain-containing protein [Winogradskyella sp.]NRB60442.1 TPM domain-containing protein [Winogradskyella sp.]
MKKIFLIVLLIFTSCKPLNTGKLLSHQKLKEFPEKLGIVNDFENIIKPEEMAYIEKMLKMVNSMDKEVAVVTISSLPENISFDKYAIQLSNHWKIGKKTKGNGLTVVLSKTLQKVRISTTDKTKKLYLSDEFCKHVIDVYMLPDFKDGKYYDGLLLGLDELVRKWME